MHVCLLVVKLARELCGRDNEARSEEQEAPRYVRHEPSRRSCVVVLARVQQQSPARFESSITSRTSTSNNSRNFT